MTLQQLKHILTVTQLQLFRYYGHLQPTAKKTEKAKEFTSSTCKSLNSSWNFLLTQILFHYTIRIKTLAFRADANC